MAPSCRLWPTLPVWCAQPPNHNKIPNNNRAQIRKLSCHPVTAQLLTAAHLKTYTQYFISHNVSIAQLKKVSPTRYRLKIQYATFICKVTISYVILIERVTYTPHSVKHKKKKTKKILTAFQLTLTFISIRISHQICCLGFLSGCRYRRIFLLLICHIIYYIRLTDTNDGYTLASCSVIFTFFQQMPIWSPAIVHSLCLSEYLMYV